MKKRYYVIHGHFYQPPRENPWTNIVERQPSAYPAHDWNERIYDECYKPNAWSRILDENGMIKEIRNNYKYMSFNFGPTLFTWLEQKHNYITKQIILADKESAKRLNGHGNALGQVYNHIIMPLASKRDQLTQIRWAKKFFRKRFERECEGIWLAETAINMTTVECLIEENIKFVILSPTQAEFIRSIESNENDQQISVSDGSIDTRTPYRVFFTTKDGYRDGRYIDVFFFNEGLSKDVSFSDVLDDAHNIAKRLVEAGGDDGDMGDKLSIIATDGETFGHHKAFGDMCLAYLFNHAGAEYNLEPINFGYFLEKCPPKNEVFLKNSFGEGSAWSCAHGTGRWIRDCGCSTGGQDGWNQKWRTPLRDAMNFLNNTLSNEFESFFNNLVDNPWDLRDEYIVLDGLKPNEELKKILINAGWRGKELNKDNLYTVRRFLDAQKYMIYTYTSCGWFFSDITGIETVQNLRYAIRAIQLGLEDKDARKNVINNISEILSLAKSNIEGKTGKTIFEEEILINSNNLERICYTAVLNSLIFKKQNLDYSSYSIELKSIDNIKDKSVFIVSIENELFGEYGSFIVSVNSFSSNMNGSVIRISDSYTFENISFGIEKLLTNDNVVNFVISDLPFEIKDKFEQELINVIDNDSVENHYSWLVNNKKSIDFIMAMNRDIPNFFKKSLSYLLTKRWNKLSDTVLNDSSLKESYTDFLVLWKESNYYKIDIDFDKSVFVFNDLLINSMKQVKQNLTIDNFNRVIYLLNIVDDFSIPVSKSIIEDMFFEVLENNFKELYNKIKVNKIANSQEIKLLADLQNFARRMNFNLSEFTIN